MNTTAKAVWEACLRLIRDNVEEHVYSTWFEPIVPIKLDDKVLTIQVKSHFVYEHLEDNYIDILSKAIRRELGSAAKLEYSVVMQRGDNADPLTVNYPATNESVAPNRPVPISGEHVHRGSIPAGPYIMPGISPGNINSNLNSRCNFANFIEGECNRLARAAGQRIAENPAEVFNPMFIFGDSGLGKTHLSQAIGVEIKARHPRKVVLYTTANVFRNEYTEAARKGTLATFLHTYQAVDVFILDDVQEFAAKEKTQDAFYHLFNHLHQNRKQIILTSDKAPVELKGLNERLVSRFRWGLIAELRFPDTATRKAILHHKIAKDGLSVPEEVIDFLAQNVTSSIRELEGALMSLLAHASLDHRDVNIDLARYVVEMLVRKAEKEVSIDNIQRAVCDYFDIDEMTLKSKTRKREIVQARQIAMYFSKQLTKSSLATIGSYIGGRDHATVLHACTTVRNLIDTDKTFKTYVEEIEKKIKFS